MNSDFLQPFVVDLITGQPLIYGDALGTNLPNARVLSAYDNKL